MLEHTLARIERRIPRERIVVVVSRDHGEETARQLAHWPVENVIVQPRNRDTAPGILLPLAHISQRDPLATVALFPSDHFILAEEQFMTAVDVAVGETQRFPGDLTLLGVAPEEDEDGYGWIEPADKEEGRQTRAVRGFWEKPSPVQRRALLARAAVWNTFVCVGYASTLWEMIRQTAPALYGDFLAIRQTLGRPQATAVINAVYTQMRPVNFSTAVCEQLPGKLRVLPIQDIGWSDWGSEERILSTLQRIGKVDEVLARLRRHGGKVTPPAPREAVRQRALSTLG
jgi:mannose-1-phosphate guanylyltransferase